MRLQLTMLDSANYRDENTNRVMNLKQIGNEIRGGASLLVTEFENGIDQTKETLVRIALKDNLTWTTKGDFNLVDILAEIIDEDLLYEIIEEGGADSYILRKRRNLS